MEPDIVLTPFPHKLVCPVCQLTRHLPDGWQEMLDAKVIICMKDQVPLEEKKVDTGGTHYEFRVSFATAEPTVGYSPLRPPNANQNRDPEELDSKDVDGDES